MGGGDGGKAITDWGGVGGCVHACLYVGAHWCGGVCVFVGGEISSVLV